jgi:hypothetical protein
MVPFKAIITAGQLVLLDEFYLVVRSAQNKIFLEMGRSYRNTSLGLKRVSTGLDPSVTEMK